MTVLDIHRKFGAKKDPLCERGPNLRNVHLIKQHLLPCALWLGSHLGAQQAWPSLTQFLGQHLHCRAVLRLCLGAGLC